MEIDDADIPTLSPEDQQTLETEYARNPKPDKAARMLIVTRVALGEKEVQVSMQFDLADFRPYNICWGSYTECLNSHLFNRDGWHWLSLDLVSKSPSDHTSKGPTLVVIWNPVKSSF